MAGERAALSLAFLNFVQQRLTRTKLLMPATAYAQTLCTNLDGTPTAHLAVKFASTRGRQFQNVDYRGRQVLRFVT